MQTASTQDHATATISTGSAPVSLNRVNGPSGIAEYSTHWMERKAAEEARGDAAIADLIRELDQADEFDHSAVEHLATLSEPEGVERAIATVISPIIAVATNLVPVPTVDEHVESASAPEIKEPAVEAAEHLAKVTIIHAPVPDGDAALLPIASEYSFPGARCDTKEAQELRTELEALAREYRDSKNYDAVRNRFCAISLAINEQGLWAPRFRPQPLISPIEVKKPQCVMLHRDQLIIDAHWLWCKKSASLYSGKYERLLDPALPFDFVLADAYAQENWNSEFRAQEQLMLPDEVQWQLLTTRSKQHVEAHRLLFDGVRAGTIRTPPRVKAIQKAIASWARTSPKIRGEEQAYANLWLAREMLGPNAATKFIAELAGLIMGRAPLEVSTARKKLNGLNLRLLRA